MNCSVAIKDIVENIGGYKLRKLNPTIIQRVYDKPDKKEKTVTVVTVKPELRAAMNTDHCRQLCQRGLYLLSEAA